MRDHHGDGYLAVVGGIGRIQGPAAVVEAHFAANARAQGAFEARDVNARFVYRVGALRGRRIAPIRISKRFDGRQNFDHAFILDHIPLGVGALEFQADAGAARIGGKRAVHRRRCAIEKHVLNAHMIEKILHVANLLARERSM